MSISFDDIKQLIENVPESATLRIASNGESFYFARRGIETTVSPDGDVVQLQGKVGSTADTMRPGAVVVRTGRIDFMQLVIS